MTSIDYEIIFDEFNCYPTLDKCLTENDLKFDIFDDDITKNNIVKRKRSKLTRKKRVFNLEILSNNKSSSVHKLCNYLEISSTSSISKIKLTMFERRIFHCNISDVAIWLDMSVSSLKRICRMMDIKRWPARKFKALSKSHDVF